MRYLALATDYDGVLAHDGRVSEETIEALSRLRMSGRKLVLVTGRELPDLMTVFQRLDLFERVVAENGALMYDPATRAEKTLASAPAPEFVEALRRRDVSPLSVGRSIVATWHPHENAVLDVIRNLGLELQVIFNKGAVMVLPGGVNKASGLTAALQDLKLSPHNVVGIGDAENDHAFLSLCECSVAVANALPMVKERADYVTDGDHGAGLTELIDRLMADDLLSIEPELTRHYVPLGKRSDGVEATVKPFGSNLMICGPSGSGKSTLSKGFLERLAEKGYQFCVIDPEGDYEAFEDVVALGSRERGPTLDEVLQVLDVPSRSAAVNLLGISRDDRPRFFAGLVTRLLEMRVTTGRPHWIVLDEAHHLLPVDWDPALLTLPRDLTGLLMITLEPGEMVPAALAIVDGVVAVGESPRKVFESFAESTGRITPETPQQPAAGEAMIWWTAEGDPEVFEIYPARAAHQRHVRKYAEGDLGPDRSFYFRGPDGKLNLKAQNLSLFLQIAEGVGDEVWMHHLRFRDYSRWFREFIKNDSLAARAEEVEARPEISAKESREVIKAAIEEEYSLPPSV